MAGNHYTLSAGADLMNEQGSYDGFSPAAYGAPPPETVFAGSAANPSAGIMPPAAGLRPLSTGEVLDRTFVLYRRRFWLFAGIGMLPAALLTVSAMLRLIFLTSAHRVGPQAGQGPDALARAMSDAFLMQAYFLPATLLFLIAYGISNAATVHAVTQISSGIGVSAASAYVAVRSRWLRWSGIALRQFWSAFWPVVPGFAAFFGAVAYILRARAASGFAIAGLLMLLGGLLMTAGMVFGVINFLRVALAMPAAVQEGLGVGAAIRRSRLLVSGRKGRIFLALLLVYALQIVAGTLQVPLLLIAVRTHGAQQILVEAIELLVQFAGTTLVAPIASIALCLFYIDERVRREGYDIELLMQRSFGGAPAVVAASSAQADPLA